MAGIECEEKPIGEGSFGSVYVATRTAPGSGDVERVAVKRLLPSVAPHRVLNELEQLARSAEGAGYAVPALLDAYRDPGGFVVVMEYFAHDDWKAYYDQLTWHEVGQYMRELLAALAHVPVAGKTGTAQHLDLETGRYSNHRYTAWFAGIAPADDPKMALVVALDEPQGWAHSGGAVAAPLFATVATSQLARHGIMTEPEPIPAPLLPTWKVLEQKRLAEEKARIASAALPKRTAAPVPPAVSSPPPVSSARWVHASRPRTSNPSPEPVMVPNFQGVHVTRALQIAETETLDLEISGPRQGQVIDQSPAAGTVLIGQRRTVELQVAALQEGG